MINGYTVHNSDGEQLFVRHGNLHYLRKDGTLTMLLISSIREVRISAPDAKGDTTAYFFVWSGEKVSIVFTGSYKEISYLLEASK